MKRIFTQSTNKGISCLKDGGTAFCNFTTNDHVPLANFSNACTAYKMHYAEQLLLTGRYTISEVGYMVSMSSQSYFRKCFKDEFHVNPSDYQKQVKS